MVSEMVQSAAADVVFHALANPTRRKVLERLSVGPATVSELAAPFDMQLPSFVQHLSVLERSRLVKSKKRGRVRTYELAPEQFKVAEDWLIARRRLRGDRSAGSAGGRSAGVRGAAGRVPIGSLVMRPARATAARATTRGPDACG